MAATTEIVSHGKVEHLIVDSAAFIKNADLRTLGNNIYTIAEVLHEIRDKTTRERLQVLPYTLQFREPSTSAIKIVSDFSKLTGDYAVLSLTDIKLLALTWQLETEHVGSDHLNSVPKKARVFPSNQEKRLNSGSLPGFYNSRRKPKTNVKRDHKVSVSEESSEVSNLNENANHKVSVSEQSSAGSDVDENCDEPGNQEAYSAVSDDEEATSSEDDEEGWISARNLSDLREKFQGLHVTQQPATPKVACITTDFAMQNVLIQMGLTLLSMDGYQIHHARTFILRCHACYATTSDMTKVFCPGCGNRGTLKRVSVSVDKNGETRMFINFKHSINTRGLIWQLPRMQGGKHSKNPILSEYQPRPQQRVSRKALAKMNQIDPDLKTADSPFLAKDIYSRSAMMGLRNTTTFGPVRNPYMDRKPTGNRRRKRS